MGLLDQQPPVACSTEKEALTECVIDNAPAAQSVTGSRLVCHYGPGQYGPCEVSCVDRNIRFIMNCDAPAGLPIACNCFANGHDTDIRTWEDPGFYASDCKDAAQMAADGVRCTNRLDCCMEWPENGKTVCSCGTSAAGGFRSCELRAESYGGRRVSICPQYEQ